MTKSLTKTRAFAFAVAVLLAATYYFEFYRVSVEEQQKEKSAKIVLFEADKINQVKIENESGTVLLKRDVDGWHLEEPVKDWADNNFAEDFIGGLTNEKAMEVAAEGDALDWSVFGLNGKPATITFFNQQGANTQLAVSEKKNFEGHSFLRRDKENKVLVVTSQWLMRAKGKAIDFRDKRFYRGKIGGIDAMTIHSQKEEFKLIRKDSQWTAERDPKLSIDQNRVRELLTSLNEIRAAEYVDSVPKDASSKAKIDLQLAGKTWTGELLQTPDKTIYAKTSDPAFQMKMTPGQADKFFEASLANLRNHREAFEFRSLAVKRMELQTALKRTTLVKNDNTWSVSGDVNAKVDSEAVKNFVLRLSESAVTEFLTSAEQGQFKGATNTISLKDEKGTVLFELSWGPILKKKIPTGEKVMILAKSSLYADPFALDTSVVESWAMNTLFPATNTEPAATPAKDVK